VPQNSAPFVELPPGRQRTNVVETPLVTSRDTTQPTTDGGDAVVAGGELGIQWVLGSSYGERSSLRAPRLRIGRGPACHQRLEHPSVSREHAEIYRQGPIHALRDLGSRNGTYLNGQRTEHGVVSNGDVIRVGDFVGIVTVLAGSFETSAFGEIAPGVFGGPTLAAALATAMTAARTDLPLIVIGPTGSGKERIARAIHELGGRSGRFHAINCSALPPTLAEAELFGHERGAFTGAERARIGHFRAAHQGTLLLDEVTDLPMAVQAKLLRVLQEREVTPLGATSPVPVDVRIVVAGQEPLERCVERKTFRGDLFMRLAGFQVLAPPLSARREEIPGLFARALSTPGASAPAMDAKLMELVCIHDFPGNVRELEFLARKLLALHGNERVLRREHAEGVLLRAPSSSTPPAAGPRRFEDRREHDRARLNEALARCNGNVTAAAASIGISRRRAYRLREADLGDQQSTEVEPATGDAFGEN
jgi:transcriptional regulator with AAA-type ATPase domain